MSMHKIPLTKIEEDGLRAHGLDIGKPSQLSDVFRQGIKWAMEQAAPTPWQEATGRAAFKNFHRSLCERFGYTHDEEFWWRDLISLEEHIAKQAAPQPEQSGLSVPPLTQQELDDLLEFHEAVCCDAGHRVEKKGMRRLAEIGAVQSVGFGKHRLTEFGVSLIAFPAAREV